MKNKIRVFIVDDDNELIAHVSRFFRESLYFTFAGSANSPEECLEELRTKLPEVDIILMDVNFREDEIDGIELARKIRSVYPGDKPRIAFMTITERALVDPGNGFHGWIPKNKGISELMSVLEEIYYRGAVYLPPST